MAPVAPMLAKLARDWFARFEGAEIGRAHV